MTDKTRTEAPGDVEDALRDGAARVLVQDVLAAIEEPRRQVSVTFEAEDLRALLERPLLFIARGKHAPPLLTMLKIDVSGEWARCAGADGWTLGVQKVRCEVLDDGGSCVISAWDARQILRMLPSPGKDMLGPVTLDFVSGGEPDEPRPVNVLYTAAGRTASYAFQGEVSRWPDYLALLHFDAPRPADAAEGPAPVPGVTALNPAFMARVAKAATVSRDQVPLFVRWYVRDSMAPLVARFSVLPEHDEFVAVLMPMYAWWRDADELSAVGARMRSLSGESEPLQPRTEGLPL